MASPGHVLAASQERRGWALRPRCLGSNPDSAPRRLRNFHEVAKCTQPQSPHLLRDLRTATHRVVKSERLTIRKALDWPFALSRGAGGSSSRQGRTPGSRERPRSRHHAAAAPQRAAATTPPRTEQEGEVLHSAQGPSRASRRARSQSVQKPRPGLH